VDSWIVLLASVSDGLPISWGFVMSWMQVSLVNDCRDANRTKMVHVVCIVSV